MATTLYDKTVTPSNQPDGRVRCLVTETVNTSANTSTVTVTLYCWRDDNTESYDANASAKITIDGTAKTISPIAIDMTTANKQLKVAESSKTITHNTDGSKSISFSASLTLNNTFGTNSFSSNLTLTKIATTPTAPTSCTITAGHGTKMGIGDSITITWSGATGTITKYQTQSRYNNGDWANLTDRSGTSATSSWGAYNDSTLMGGKTIQYRVRACNGSRYSGWKESNTLTISGVMNLNVSGAWKQGSTWINDGGTWKRAKRVWVNVNGTWKEA